MSASLLLGGSGGVEVIDQSVNDKVRLAAGGALPVDFGAPTPDQTTIASLSLDGDIVIGDRTGNRVWSLPLNVYGTGAADIAATIDLLAGIVGQRSWQVQWTPDGGLPVIFDCYRATVVRTRNPSADSGGFARIVVTFASKPFGRSPDVASVSAAAAQTQLDSFATAPSGATLDTAVKFEGTGSAKVTLTTTSGGSPAGTFYKTSAPVARTYSSSKDLTGARALTMRVQWPSPAFGQLMEFTLTLTSATGNAVVGAAASYNKGDTTWRLVTFPLTGSLGTLDLTAVTGYSLTATSAYTVGGVVTSARTMHLDDQRWLPASSALTTTTHAANLLLPATLGSARAPANLALTNGATFTSFLLHTPPDDQDVDAQILTSLDITLTNQTITVAQANAGFAGTYSVALGVGTLGSGSVTATVTITQRENGVAVGSPKVLALTYTAGGLHVVDVGEVTLPLYAVPADNNLTDYTVQVQIAGTDRYTELMLLDTRGQTVYTDSDLGAAVAAVYVDEPAPLQSGSNVYGSASDRTAAYGVLGNCVPGAPIQLDPGSNKILAWVNAATPTITATYSPRWLDDRVA